MVAPLATASLMDDGRGTGGAYLRITNWKIPRRWRNLVERMRSGILDTRVREEKESVRREFDGGRVVHIRPNKNFL